MLVTLVILVSVPLAPAAVRNVNVMRINNTAVSVSWTPLTITEARGRLTGYVITLTPVSLSRKRQASVVMRTVLPSESSVTIGGLDPTQQYTVTVAGSTSAGNGNMSIDVTPSPPVPSPSVTPVQPGITQYTHTLPLDSQCN